MKSYIGAREHDMRVRALLTERYTAAAHLKASPAGLMLSTMCRLERTWLMKWLKMASRSPSGMPACLANGRLAMMTFSYSSRSYRLGTSPVAGRRRCEKLTTTAGSL